MDNKNNIDLTKWYSDLDYLKQLNIIDYINDYDDELSELSPEEVANFRSLIDNITDIIVQEKDSDGVVVTKLLNYGLDKISANCLYKYCNNIAAPRVDALLINKLDTEQLDKTVKFIINNVMLYKNYTEMPFKEYVSYCGFSNTNEAKRILRFILCQIDKVSNRELDTTFLFNKIQNKFNILESHAKIIIDNINNNNTELIQANILNKINQILIKHDCCPIE